MPTASVIEVVDSLVSAVNTAWAPSSPDLVERVWVTPSIKAELHKLAGRRVYFAPGPYENSPATRSEDEWRYEVVAACIDHYEEQAEPASSAVKAWVDALALFVETYLVDGLDFGVQGAFLTALTGREIWTESISVVRLYDPDWLAEKKVFISEIAYVFREVR